MKILIAAEIFYPEIGGPATYVLPLIKKFLQMGWQVRIIAYSYSPAESHKKCGDLFQAWQGSFNLRLNFVQADSLGGYVKYFWYTLKNALTCQAIFAQGPVLSGFPALIAGTILRKRLVLKVVGDQSWEWAAVSNTTELGIDEYQRARYNDRFRSSRNLLKPLKFQLVDKIQRFTTKRFDKVMVPSSYGQQMIMGWGVEPSRVMVVPNAIEFATPKTPPYKGGTNELVSLYNKGREEEGYDFILSVGRLTPWKGHRALINSMPYLIKQNEKFRLLIAGSGPEEQNLRLQIKNLGLHDKVLLLGRVSKDKIGHYYAKAFCFVLNSGYESFPHTVLEAWAAGAPVLASRVGGNPEIIEDGENGILFDYNNENQIKGAVMSLLKIDGLRDKLIGSGEKSLRDFSEERMVEETLKLIRFFGLR